MEWCRILSLSQIHRNQNKQLYEKYLIHKKQMEKKNRGNEKILYHGTKEDNVQDISSKGFNRSYCGINGNL